MTQTGLNRQRYSREVEPQPSRFDGTDAYTQWAARADAWVKTRYAVLVSHDTLENWPAPYLTHERVTDAFKHMGEIERAQPGTRCALMVQTFMGEWRSAYSDKSLIEQYNELGAS